MEKKNSTNAFCQDCGCLHTWLQDGKPVKCVCMIECRALSQAIHAVKLFTAASNKVLLLTRQWRPEGISVAFHVALKSPKGFKIERNQVLFITTIQVQYFVYVKHHSQPNTDQAPSMYSPTPTSFTGSSNRIPGFVQSRSRSIPWWWSTLMMRILRFTISITSCEEDIFVDQLYHTGEKGKWARWQERRK